MSLLSSKADMAQSHAQQFQFLTNSLQSGKIEIAHGEQTIFEPTRAASPERLMQQTIASACKSFEEGRLFDFDVMPNADLVKLSDHLRQMDGDVLKAPFEDWRFCICATSDFNESGGPIQWATSLYVLEGLPDNHVQMSEYTLQAENGLFMFLGSMISELPLGAGSKGTIIGCNDFFTDKIRSLMDSIVDPTMAALVMLNTKGVEVSENIPPRAARRRAEKVGETVPSHWSVGASEYFTALRHPSNKLAAGSGTKKSPIPHLRRGHWRNVAPDRHTWIRDCLVNVRSESDDAFVDRTRTAYKAKALKQ